MFKCIVKLIFAKEIKVMELKINKAMQHAVTKAGIKALGLQFSSYNKAMQIIIQELI